MFLRIAGLDIHALIDGPEGAPALVLLHSLGTNAHVWDGQVQALARQFRVIRPDLRGHGLTGCTPGPYSMAGFADDLAALLDALAVERAHIGGISIGGMIAQAFAAGYGHRAASLILVDTAMAIPPPASWVERAATVRTQGIGAIADAVIGRWVTPASLDTAATAGLRAMLLRTPVEGYAAAAEAIAAADLTASTSKLALPALILVGAQDQSTPVSAAAALHQAITGSSMVILPDAAHIPLAEQADAVTANILAFVAPDIADPFEAGMQVRKQVLGEEHVARALAGVTDLDRDFQTFITRTAWGGIWTRPGLDRRTRSLLTIAMMASLGHEDELKLHLRASKNTGARPADVAEALLQVAIYAGVPAANAAFRAAKEIFAEIYP